MIEKLDDHTRAKLRSTQILTSLPQLISELVQNSLDAGATRVEVGVDCEEWYCWVKDNGSGISKDGLNKLGKGLDEGRYSSSKSYDSNSLDCVSTFGFRGEALASAANLCCLEISSRTTKSRETWSIILKGTQSLYSGPAVRWRRETQGTVVCIRDAFYNLPVRRSSHTPAARTLELIRQEIETYALVFPHVSFTIEHVEKDREGNNGTSSSKGRIIRIPQTTSTLAAFRTIFGRALTEHVENIDVSSDGLSLSGFISLNGAHSKSYQYIYVNNHPIARDELHRAIDSVFAASTFGKNALDELGETILPRSQVRRSPRKAEKRPVYVLNLLIPPAELDNCIEPAKARIEFQNRGRILNFLVSTIKRFLIKNGFSLQTYKTPDDPGTPTRKKRRGAPMDEATPPPDDSCYHRQENHIVDWDDCNEIEGTNEVLWMVPATGEVFVIDKDSGNSRPFLPSTSTRNLYDDECGISIRRTLPSRNGHAIEGEQQDVPGWLQRALLANKNYQAQQNNIRDLGPSCCTQDASEPGPTLPRGMRLPGMDGATIDELNFERLDLCNAQVICQIDKKFIACLLNVGAEPALVLVDQHAADERVRVEQFLRELCQGFLGSQRKTGHLIGLRELEPPVPVLLAEHEGRKLAESKQLQELLLSWGFCVKPGGAWPGLDDDSVGYTQVWVEAVPAVVSEKLLMGKELQDTIKGIIAQVERQPLPPSSFSAEDGEFAWVKALRWCPSGLLDLVNSKACRGAIMFNDTLTTAQCKKLIGELSATAFPFQCAHGRPSMVPLTNLGTTHLQRKKHAVNWANWELGLELECMT